MLSLRIAREDTTSGTRIEMLLRGSELPPQLLAEPIFFELLGEEATDLSVFDGFVGGLIHFLMESKQDLHIEGKVSRSCLRSLAEYQRFWSLVRPDRCSVVSITADEVIADSGDTRNLPAIANYSGGLDSAFTVARHSLKLCGMESFPPQAVMIVHGLDVTLANQAGFNSLLNRLQPVIEELGLKRYIVRTNIKEMALQDWLDAYSAQLVSCLHMVSHRHSTALVASDGYAQCPIYYYGGNPISLPMLSTSRLKVMYDGGPWGRTDKARLLAQYPTIMRSLKFCWEGSEVDRNCGQCLKCFLTYMNFRAAGVEKPECFDEPIPDDILGNYAIRHGGGLVLGYEVLEQLSKVPELAELTARFAAPILRFEKEQEQRAQADALNEGPWKGPELAELKARLATSILRFENQRDVGTQVDVPDRARPTPSRWRLPWRRSGTAT
jgi:hypothetical protein